MKNFRLKRKEKSLDEEFETEYLAQPSREPAPSNASPTPDDLSVSLRAEMLPASELAPDVGKVKWSRINFQKVGVILGIILLVCLGCLIALGPGRSMLETVLTNLAREPVSTVMATPTSPVKNEVVILPSETVRPTTMPTRTSRPLSTVTMTAAIDTPTLEPTGTVDSSGCVDVLAVTLEDVGKTLCMRGEILNFEARESGFLIAFSNERGAMYWVSYDLVWEPAKEGLCVEVTGEVMQIANSPVLIFGYQNLPVICTNP
jgi:hypothetical protein